MRRSMLFIPGNSPNLLMNADVLGSDAIILDLEDAVAPTEKDSARVLVRNAIKYMGFGKCEVIVRINAICSASARALCSLRKAPTLIGSPTAMRTVERKRKKLP